MPTAPELPLDVEGCRDLVLAIFRLTVCDILGLRYGHDGPVRHQQLRRDDCTRRRRALTFLVSERASDLADAAGFSAVAARTEVCRLLDED
ncbi:MAG: hypothetical protein M3O87_04170 [Candidatus Dormibacteraeota bacterium]|nr:hypothetical protein [Candidatus Dormibacteraeota bacterium]